MSLARQLLFKFPHLLHAVDLVRDWRAHRVLQRRNHFGQHGEDVIIRSLLEERGATGSYVDVGCSHPFRLSNTYLLYLNGWRGVCVDPLPRYAAPFKRWRPDDQFVNSAVGRTAGRLPLFEFSPNVLSTMDQKMAAAYVDAGYQLAREVVVDVRPLNEILESASLVPPLSLLTVDVEGHELDVLQSISLGHWQPAVVCVEVRTGDGAASFISGEYLTSRGYSVACTSGLNDIYIRN